MNSVHTVMLRIGHFRETNRQCLIKSDSHRKFQVRRYQGAHKFETFLLQVPWQYRGWKVTVLLDSEVSNTAKTCPTSVGQLGSGYSGSPNVLSSRIH
jgi:hypothetical protein